MFGCVACGIVSAGISVGVGLYKMSQGDVSGAIDVASAATLGVGKLLSRSLKVQRTAIAQIPKGARDGTASISKRMRQHAAQAARTYQREVVRPWQGVTRLYGTVATMTSMHGYYQRHTEWRRHLR